MYGLNAEAVNEQCASRSKAEASGTNVTSQSCFLYLQCTKIEIRNFAMYIPGLDL